MWLVLPDWDGLEQRGISTGSEMSPSTVPFARETEFLNPRDRVGVGRGVSQVSVMRAGSSLHLGKPRKGTPAKAQSVLGDLLKG